MAKHFVVMRVDSVEERAYAFLGVGDTIIQAIKKVADDNGGGIGNYNFRHKNGIWTDPTAPAYFLIEREGP